MSLLCMIGRHRPLPHVVRNQGFTFGRCCGCERDLVRSMGGWQTVPRGFRIVWRSAGAAAAPTSMPVPTAGTLPVESAGARMGLFATLVCAGARALIWSVRDKIAGLSRRVRFQRRPAMLRLPAR